MVQKVFFFHLVDMTMYNAYILYKENTGTKCSFYKFKLEASRHLVLLHSVLRESAGRPHLSSRESDKRLNGKNAINCTCSVIVIYHCTVQVNIFHHVFLNDHKVPGLDAGMTRKHYGR